MKKMTYKTHFKAHTQTKTIGVVLVVSFFMFFLIGNVSAFEFDNIGRYDEDSRIFTIKNSILGIPFLQLGTVAEIHLDTPDVVSVLRGKNRTVAEFTINNYGGYSNAFKKMEFYNVRDDMKKFDRDFTYKYEKSLGFETVDDYETVCKDKLTVNGTLSEECHQELIGTHQEEKFGWVEFDTSKELPIGEITIGVFTDVLANEKVEWIPTLFGVRIPEWAVWEDSFEIGLKAWWDFDRTSGDVVDIFSGVHNGTALNVLRGQDGIIKNAFDYNGINASVNLSSPAGINFDYSDEFTISTWINMTSASGIIIAKDGAGAGQNQFRIYMSGGKLTFDVGTIATNFSALTYNDSQWHHVVGVYNGVITTLYVDNVVVSSHANGTNTYDTPIYIGRRRNGLYITGLIDEMGIWNRTLNATEISNLYNGGNGINPTSTSANPVVTLNSPVTGYNTTIPTIDFNCTASDDKGITNVSLLINGTIEQTNTSGINGTDYLFTHILTDGAGFYNWSCIVYDDINQSTTASVRTFTYLNDLAVSLVSPVAGYNSTSKSITFNGTASDDIAIVNVSLYIDGVLNQTNSSGLNATNYLFIANLSDGNHNWTYRACDAVSCLSATTRTFSIDTILPIINITFPTPTINYHTLNTNLSLNWTATDANLDSCWYNYNGTNITVTCSDNTTKINITTPFNKNVTFYANDTFGNLNNFFRALNFLAFESLRVFNTSSFETATETFYLNITTNGSVPTDIKLIYNGTSYSGTATNTFGNDYNISRTIDVPTAVGNKNFFFNFTIAGIEVSSPNSTQIINLTSFVNCIAGTPFINISFKNETILEELVTATISSSWNYWLGTGTIFKTLSFSNATENSYYTFCLSGVNRTLETNVSLTYSNSISQQRNFGNDFTLTNTTTSQTLFLLPTAEGVYVTFQVVNIAEQPISGVSSNVTKAGTFIASGTTDDAGTISYFLDPDASYVFTFFKSGYDIYVTTLTPTQTTFTIVLGGESVVEENDYTRGITYSIVPSAISLVNNTNTFFNFTLTSTYWDVEEFGFNLTDQNSVLLNSTNAFTNGGTVFVLHNTSNNTRIIMTFFWTIDGNVSIGSTFWTVLDSSGTGFGLTTFFSHLGEYLDTEMFGLNSNSMVILIYIIIFIAVGIMSFKYGMTSPATISLVIFGLVFLFESHLGWIPSISGFPVLTILFALVSIGLILKEGLK